ncbi:MAG: hypothetical protein ABMB14_12590 [Myxococcota bacterium]
MAVRAGIGADKWTVDLRGAYASGDATPDDDHLTDFRFDRDYDVGFVLLDEVASAYDLAAYRQATDPSVTAHPPDGVDALAAEGAFHQAVAVQPVVAVRPEPWLALRGGAVAAWSTGPIAQPYTTFRNGGVPTNALGTPSDGRYLGTELDLAVEIGRKPVDDRLTPSAQVQVGHAWPSRALANGGPGIDALLVTARAVY